ncbi:MAG: 6-phosphofructokinase, partial [Calditrichaeota bacterium]|nr:6-phosphofructokinase [Calditrichota bacterium]
MSKEKILIVTGGGDCPGLNAVIRSIVLSSENQSYEVYGSINAFNGLLKSEPELIHLTKQNVKGIHSLGGTILGTTNKGIPSQFPVKMPNGQVVYQDRMNELVNRINEYGFTVVVNIGGDGSQRISNELQKRGINVIGIPKTIDNDLPFTQFTFGFRTAVEIATDAVDKLSTTAASHQRVMILEVMGRNAGWIALNTGIAGGADFILIPELPFDLNLIEKRLNEILVDEKAFVIIVVAEGAYSKTQLIEDEDPLQLNKKAGGIGHWLMKELETRIDREIRL